MTRQLRPRFWLEVVAALAGTLLTVLTLLDPTWIEGVFDRSPDGGTGDAEWLFALVPLVVAALSAALAAREWRRAAA